MKHADFEALSAFLEGDLSAGAEEQVKEHLASCPACRTELEAAKGLRNRIEGLPRSVQPAHSLLQFGSGSPATAFETPTASRRWWANPWIAAAALPAAALLALLLRPAQEPQLTPKQLVAVKTLEQACTGTEAQMEAVMAVWPAPLRTDTDPAMRTSFEELDRALAETRAALAENPGDSHLAERLSSIYQKKLSLMRHTMQRWST